MLLLLFAWEDICERLWFVGMLSCGMPDGWCLTDHEAVVASVAGFVGELVVICC